MFSFCFLVGVALVTRFWCLVTEFGDRFCSGCAHEGLAKFRIIIFRYWSMVSAGKKLFEMCHVWVRQRYLRPDSHLRRSWEQGPRTHTGKIHIQPTERKFKQLLPKFEKTSSRTASVYTASRRVGGRADGRPEVLTSLTLSPSLLLLSLNLNNWS